jgi:hypothetical protein
MKKVRATRVAAQEAEPPVARRLGGVRRHGRGTAATEAARVRGPRLHAIDQARMLHALEDPPHKTQADIARETGRSPAAISVLCRVGAALHPLTAAEREPLLTRHLTYTLLAHLVARHPGAESLRRAIVAAAARPPLPTRRTSGGQSSSGTGLWTRGADVGDPGRTPLDPLPATPTTTAFAYRFVAAEWQADAEAAFDEFAAFLRTTLDGVMRQAVRAIGAGDGPLRLTDPRPSTRRPDASTARADAARRSSRCGSCRPASMPCSRGIARS